MLLSSKETGSTWLIDIVVLTALLGIFYAIWIGAHPLFTPDEGRYSEVAREMITTGDYITPRLDGVVFLDKPILYYWLQASAIKFYGLKESALRFWPALIGVLGCLFVYLAGRQVFNRRTGFLSALLLATSPMYYGGAHYANLDLEVASFISITLLCILMATQATTPRLQRGLFIAAYIFASLAALTKGLIGLFFPAIIAGTWILLLNRWYLLKNARLLTGIAIFACITLPWYILVQRANPQFFHFFFITQQFSRFLTRGAFNNQNVIWFYLPIIAIGFFPWTIFLIQAFLQTIHKVWTNRQSHAAELYLLLWVVLIFIFFSIPHSKTIGYILPVFPGLALIVGRYLDTNWMNTKNLGIKLGLFSYIFIAIAIGIICFIPQIKEVEIAHGLISYLTFTGILFLVSGILIFFFKNKTLGKPMGTLLLTSILFALTISASSKILNQNTIKPLALHLKRLLQPNDEVVAYYKYYQDLPIYTERRTTIVADWDAPDISQYDNWLRELWFNMPYQDTSDWLINDKTFWQRWHSQTHLFVLMHKNYWDEFQKKAQSNVYPVDHYNDVILISNQPLNSEKK